MVHKVEIVGDIQELIDTQWDVNSKMDVQITDRMIELIDTQWDVNHDFSKWMDYELGN